MRRKKLLGFLILVVLFCVGCLLFRFPELDAFRHRSWGTVISDRNGVVLRVLPADNGVKREWVPLSEIPPGAVRIFIRAEDRRFYFHSGVDVFSLVAGFYRNLKAGRTVSGASTITMQLARLVHPHSGGMRGKIVEAWDAIRLEANLSKKEILELYLNSIPFGSNIEGLAAITRARFGSSVRELDDNRAALLASVPRRPLLYDPALNPDAAVSAAMALSARCRLDLREEELWQAAKEAAMPTSNQDDPRAPFFAPHFTERLARMEPKLVTVTRSTLDLALQLFAEEELALEISLLSNKRISNGAILAIENETGAVRVYVGSGSWFNEAASGKIDGVRFRAQPGSCLKPFLYAMALDAGFSPNEIMPDLPTVFGSREAYVPSNFNNRFNGPVRLRIALASSLNIPAVYVLERLGVRTFEEYLVSLGFDSINETIGTHGTGLALGNAEVSLEEMVRAFSVFPRMGSPVEFRWTEDGKPLPNQAIKPVMSPYAAWMIADILSDRSSRFVGFGPAPSLATPFESMFKTGTANQFQHIWALGATRRFTVGVWMGNFSGETVIGSTGSSIPARIAVKLLGALEESAEQEKAQRTSGKVIENLAGLLPQGTTEVQICALSGMAAGPYCTGLTREFIRNEKIPTVCNWHTQAGLFYPGEYRSWLSERFRSGGVRQEGTGRIRTPVTGAVFYLDPSLPAEAQALRVETTGFSESALIFVDGELAGSLNHAGVYALPLLRGRHSITVADNEGSSASADFEVK